MGKEPLLLQLVRKGSGPATLAAVLRGRHCCSSSPAWHSWGKGKDKPQPQLLGRVWRHRLSLLLSVHLSEAPCPAEATTNPPSLSVSSPLQ